MKQIGVEPGLSQEIATSLPDVEVNVLPLIEELHLAKSPAEVAMIRQAEHYAEEAVRKVIATVYYRVSEMELFLQGRAVQTQIIKEFGYDVLTTIILAGTAMHAAECKRTFFLKPPTGEVIATFKTMQEARRRALEMVHNGTGCVKIDCQMKEFLLKEG